MPVRISPPPVRSSAQDSDVICFESRPDSEDGSHAAINFTPFPLPNDPQIRAGAFPPNTLFELKDVKEAGDWEAPGGLRPRQRLITVTATYRMAEGSLDPGSKMCTTYLRYGNSSDFVTGFNDILHKPVCVWLFTINSSISQSTLCTPGESHSVGRRDRMED